MFKKLVKVILTLSIVLAVAPSITIIHAKNTNNISATTVTGVRNWAGISSVQQFSYMNKGLAYGYIQNDYLKITLPNQKTLTIKVEYPLLGDIISDDSGNIYVIWGRENTTNDNNIETMFISKYSASGALIKTTGFVGEIMKGAEASRTKLPFSAGSCSSAIHDGKLMVLYAQGKYDNHQSSNTIAVNISDMSPIQNPLSDYNNYVSHSFNQKAIWSDKANSFIFANHGDAFPRGMVISGYKFRFTPFHFYLQTNSSTNMVLVNKTYAQLGDIVETSQGIVLIGASAESISEKAKTENQNLFIQIFDPTKTSLGKDAFIGGSSRSGASIYVNDFISDTKLQDVTDYGVHWLTDYTDSSVVAPHAVVADDKIVIFWHSKKEARYMILSASGELIVPETSMGQMPLNSYERPVYYKGKIYWATASNNKIELQSLDPATGEHTKPITATEVATPTTKPTSTPTPTPTSTPTPPPTNDKMNFLETLPYETIVNGSVKKHSDLKDKATIVIFGKTVGCVYSGVNNTLSLIKKYNIENDVNLLTFIYQSSASTIKADFEKYKFSSKSLSVYRGGDKQMWKLLDNQGVNFPVIAYFNANGELAHYKTSNDAVKGIEADMDMWLKNNGIEKKTSSSTSTSSKEKDVKITSQPAANTTVTEGNIKVALSVKASVSTGKKLTYRWALSTTDSTPAQGTLTQIRTSTFNVSKNLKEGVYYYFCILYVDGKEAARTNIATINVTKGAEINPEYANLKNGYHVLSYPTKKNYVVGGKFDTSGVKVIYKSGSKITDVTNKVLFYTSKTVKLTQGRAFTTAGTKVVELRYTDGKFIGKYTIKVSKK